MPDIIKKPHGGAYGQWFADNWAKIKAELLGEKGLCKVSVPMITKRASELWTQMSTDERDPWRTKAMEKAILYKKYQEMKRTWEDRMDGFEVGPNVGPKKSASAKVNSASMGKSSTKENVRNEHNCIQGSSEEKDEMECIDKAAKIKRKRTLCNGEKDSFEPMGEHGWQRFSPKLLNPSCCMSRIWSSGRGGQCQNKRQGCSDFCKAHSAKQTHGRVDGPIPKAKLLEFLRASGATHPENGAGSAQSPLSESHEEPMPLNGADACADAPLSKRGRLECQPDTCSGSM